MNVEEMVSKFCYYMLTGLLAVFFIVFSPILVPLAGLGWVLDNVQKELKR
jgi:hypothetical protein